jgi:arginine exporter protein ArgO
LTDNGLALGTAPALPLGLSYIISTGTAGRVDLIITAVPEPSSMMLVILGTAGLAIRRRARR